MIAEDVEGGLRVLRRELLPGLIVRDRLKGQRPIQGRGEPRDLLGRDERFRAAEPVGLPGVPWLGECRGGDFGDVGRIDQGCRCVTDGARTTSPAWNWSRQRSTLD